MALSRFEAFAGYRDVKAFHIEQAIAFKRHLSGGGGHVTTLGGIRPLTQV